MSQRYRPHMQHVFDRIRHTQREEESKRQLNDAMLSAKREYFAAHAPITLQDARAAILEVSPIQPSGNELMTMLAQMRIAYADAMITEWSKN